MYICSPEVVSIAGPDIGMRPQWRPDKSTSGNLNGSFRDQTNNQGMLKQKCDFPPPPFFCVTFG